MAKLLNLHLENYRAIKELDLNIGGADGKVIGQNRIGKTTVIESICYLLTDKLLGGSSDIPSIKPQDDTRAKVIVEGTFRTAQGDITLRKEFYEKWVRPRGSANEELQGHATDYYINGAKQSRAKDFFEALEGKFGIPTEISGIDAYQLAIDPFYFGQTVCGSLAWKLARRFIIDIVGDVTPSEIFRINPKLEIAKADLEAHQYDDAETKKAVKGELDGYKKKLIANEGLTEEYRRVRNQDVSEDEYADAQAKNDRLDEQIAAIKLGASNPYAEEQTKLNERIGVLQEEYRKASMATVDHSKSEALRSEIYAKQSLLGKVQLQQRSNDAEAKRLTQEISNAKEAQEGYKSKLRALQEEDKAIYVEDVCPTCGQKLPEEKVQEAFNAKRAEISERAQAIRQKAIANKKSIEFLETALANVCAIKPEADPSALNDEIAELNKKLSIAVQEEKEQVKEPDPKIMQEISAIRARLGEIKTAMASQNNASQIAELKSQKYALQAIFSKRIAANDAATRLEEIKAQNVAIGKAIADAEQRIWAVGEYVKTKLQLLDEHMASKLGEVRFQLIKENIKAGSYDEVCVPYVISPATKKRTATLFPDGSKSEQIYTGIQIIKAIRDAKGWEPLPIVFDQGGELDETSTRETAYFAEAQIIEVKVEGDGKTPTFVPLIG